MVVAPRIGGHCVTFVVPYQQAAFGAALLRTVRFSAPEVLLRSARTITTIQMMPKPPSCRDNLSYAFATPADLPEIQGLLTQCGLPTGGLTPVLGHCLLARSGPTLVGTVALEPYGPFGLLRSLAVSPDHRRQGVGQDLYAKIISHARLQQVERLYLLTIGAEPYFTARGFEPVARDTVPAVVRASTQFQHICPASAVCMSQDIRAEVIHASADLLRMRPDVPGARMWAVSLQNTMLT